MNVSRQVGGLDKLQPWGAVVLRLALGISMTVHGYDKIVPKGALHGFAAYVTTLGIPAWLGWVSAFTEFLGGIFLLLGLLTRLSAALITVNMVVALVMVGLPAGFGIANYIFALVAIAIMLIFYGPGALAVDRLIGLS